MSALGFSIVASIVLTIVLNVGLRLFPGAAQWLRDNVGRLAERSAPAESERDRRHVRVIFPWKAMLIGSLVLTVVINLLLVVFR